MKWPWIYFIGVALFGTLGVSCDSAEQRVPEPIRVTDGDNSDSVDYFSVMRRSRDALEPLLADSFLIPAVLAILGDTSPVMSFITEQFDQARGHQIDLILMVHLVAFASPDQNVVVGLSQKVVQDLLEEYRYDVIGLEASSLERVTFNGLVREYQNLLRLMEFPYTESNVREYFDSLGQSDGVLGYLQDYPDAHVIGISDETFPLFDLSLQLRGQDYPERIAFYEQARAFVNDLRSDIALAIMIQSLRESRGRGVIVMGGGHSELLVRRVEDLGIRSRIFVAIPPDSTAILENFRQAFSRY